MAGMLSEVKAYLETLSPSVGTIFRGYMPEGTTVDSGPDACVALYEYGGQPPALGFGIAGVQYETPGLQVVVRGVPDDYDAPAALAKRIYDALAEIQAPQALSGTAYLTVLPQQTPFPLRRDEKRRVHFVCNYLVTKVPS